MNIQVCSAVVITVLCVSAPSAPTKVHLSSNGTDSIIVQWTRPLEVIYRVDRYYIQYQAVGKPHSSEEVTVEDVNNSHDFYEVNLLTVQAVQICLELGFDGAFDTIYVLLHI